MKRIFKSDAGVSALAVVVSAGAMLAAGGYSPASAQTPAAAPTTTTTSDEVIVTATRRDANVQDVAVAVTAITEKQIEDAAPRTIQDLTGLAPNVTIGATTAVPGGGAIYMRGLGYQDVEKSQNPSVGVSVDGVFLGTNTGQLVDGFDIRQVEINRGPQGIFFGKNTTGGVIAISRSLPTHEWGFRGSAAGGDYNSQVYRAIVNMPVGEHAGLKIGGQYRSRDGYEENLFTHTDNGQQEYKGGTVAFDWDMNSWLNVLASVDVVRSEGGGTPVQYGSVAVSKLLGLTSLPGYNAQTGSPNGLRPHQVQNDFLDSDTLDFEVYNLTFTADTPLGQFVSQSAYINSHDNVHQDFDGTCALAGAACNGAYPNFLFAALPGASLHTIRDQDYTQFTQEFRLSGSVSTIDYLVGAYYYKHEISLKQDSVNLGSVQRSGEKNDSTSIFGNLDWHVTPAVTLSAGVRSINESKDFRTRYDTTGGAVIVAPITDSKDWDQTVTRFGASWKASESNLFYLTRSEGFRSGGFSIRGTLSERQGSQANCGVLAGCPGNNFLAYEPENVTSWELGAKNSVWDGGLTLNVALFQSDIEDLQRSEITVTGYGPGTNTYINNLPKVKIKGAEFEATWRAETLSPQLAGLTFAASLGLQDGEIVDGSVDPRRLGGAPGPKVDFYKGTRLPRMSEVNFGLRTSYSHQIGAGELQLYLSDSYVDDFSLTSLPLVLGGADDPVEAYWLHDASIAYEWGHYRLSLTGKNLLDEEYRGNSLPVAYFQGWGDPRTWQVELSAKF